MTIISFRHHFIFLANMKCGSTTLHKLLYPFADIISYKSVFDKPIGKHDNARQVKKYIESLGYQWDDFYVFTTVRDPLTRIISCYNYEIKYDYLKPKIPIDDYIWRGRYHEHFQDLDFFTRPGVNQVIRMEDFEKELPQLWQKLGLGEFNDTIPNLNSCQSKKPDQIFNSQKKNQLIEILKKRHQSDYAYY